MINHEAGTLYSCLAPVRKAFNEGVGNVVQSSLHSRHRSNLAASTSSSLDTSTLPSANFLPMEPSVVARRIPPSPW